MYGINEIKKQNAQKKADAEHSARGRFITQRNGDVWLYSASNGVKVLEAKRDAEDIAKFLKAVRGKTAGAVATIVQEYFKPAYAQ